MIRTPSIAMRAKPALALLAALAACGLLASASAPALAQGAPAASSVSTPAMAARTRKIVDAANVFLATLTPEQKAKAMFAFDDQKQRTNWSNFPDAFVPRKGVRWGEMNDEQRAAFMHFLGTMLSPQGVTMIKQQQDADDIMKITPPATGAGIHFGSEWYYAAFLGTPSTSSPWMFQLGAHHVGLNATFVGSRLTLSPTLTGGEPLKYFHDGKPVYVVSDEAKAAQALLDGLTAEQKAKAVIATKRINLVLGPGHDGQMVQPEGLPGSAMTARQKTQLIALIHARLGMINADHLAPIMAAVRKNLDRTYFAWWGPSELGQGYFRVTGPTVFTEFAPQDDDVRYPDPTQHAHNIYRDPTNEYGAAWTALK